MSLSHVRMACSQQPLHLQPQPPQAPAPQQAVEPQTPPIIIPNMANYSTSSRLLAANGHVLKTVPLIQQGVQGVQQSVVQLQMPGGQMASVITDSSKSPGMVQVGGGGVPVEGVVVHDVPHDVQHEVPRTKGGKEKRYPCPYCSWSGVDNWCLKRHLNTHLKPYVCALCDYKAARTERLQTHVLKVHNKRSCIRCSYMADDQSQLNVHLQEHQ